MSDALGLLEVARVAGAVDHLDALRRRSRSAMRWAMSTYLRVEPADDQQHRHPQLAEALPVRRLRALPEHAQLVRETFDGVVGAAFVESGSLGWQRREERLREPAFEERVDAVALDLLRRAARRPRAGRRARRRRRCPATRSTSTRRCTTSGRSSASCRHSRPPCEYPTYVARALVERVRGRHEVGAVGHVDGARHRRRQRTPAPVPTTPRLREPVHEARHRRSTEASSHERTA